ncbi:hypothetical protein A2U01_0088344 [Trifolium medium]|uniref:Uncharacterized protein n=1 Tax=Trifolium medium TaxID=97028 RepID=A0A392U3X2_9FABA|nr:hypothetical protein [Trifolium medium]
MTKATASLCQSDGARRITMNTRGILTMGGRVELEPLDLMWEIGCDIKEQKIGLKFALAN